MAKIKQQQIKQAMENAKEKKPKKGKGSETSQTTEGNVGGSTFQVGVAKPDTLFDLVDQNMVQLLKACSTLKMPTMEELEPKLYRMGEVTRQKTLILDMDETLVHAKFFQETYEELEKAGLGFIAPAEEGDCA